MTTEKIINKVAWDITRKVLCSGNFTRGSTISENNASDLVRNATAIASCLFRSGCFDSKYGDKGSVEVEYAPALFAELYANGNPYDPTILVYNLFERCKLLAASGVLSEEERRRSRALDKEAEEAKAREEAAKAKARAEREQQEKEKQEREARKEVAKARLEEIKRERNAK